MEKSVRAEIEGLHNFFTVWFRGEVPNTDEAFARVVSVLPEGFRLVPPSGQLTSRDEILGRIRLAHGSHRDGDFRLRVEGLEIRTLAPGVAFALYEEWNGAQGRISAALLRARDGTPCGVEWIHVHETWLPE